ncbi:MAG: PqqD family peptide modification chaperone [Methylocella sp.]
MGPVETLALPIDDGWVLCQPDIDRLAVLNATGKIVWDLVCGGLAQQEIASAFGEHFGLPADAALATVRTVIGGLEEAGFLARPAGQAGTQRCVPSPFVNGPAIETGPNVHCGTFRFGDRRVEMHSTLAEIGRAYFARFQHRALDEAGDADVLAFSTGPRGYRLTFRGAVAADANSLTELVGRTHELFLSWEHPKCEFLAYFHAAAVSRGEHSVLMPGVSGSGKSTLAAYLAAHAFAYLGDDTIAMCRADWELRPLPTCLSLKSGSWPILTALYPELPHLPVALCHGRDVRYVEPRLARYAGSAPPVILFPSYAKSGGTHLRALTPLETMTRLIETSTDLHRPATGATLAEFLQFVEHTPAYELVYGDLPSAKAAIEEWLDHST